MEFFFNDPDTPRFPPPDIRLKELRAIPNSNGNRLLVTVELTPFQESPNIEIDLTDSNGYKAASASIIEPRVWKLELTLHIRRKAVSDNHFVLTASVSYPDLGKMDRQSINLEIPITTN